MIPPKLLPVRSVNFLTYELRYIGAIPDKVNQCCRQHDVCYDRQRGQAACDDAFCGCLKAAVKGAPLCEAVGHSDVTLFINRHALHVVPGEVRLDRSADILLARQEPWTRCVRAGRPKEGSMITVYLPFSRLRLKA